MIHQRKHIVFVSSYPPSQVTLNEYGYHLVKAFRRNPEIGRITVLCPFLPRGDSYDRYAEHGIELIPCWQFNSMNAALRIRSQLKKLQADAVIFNIQFMTFGEGKVQAALGLFSPWLSRNKEQPVITLLHNITETVNLENIGMSKGGVIARIMLKIGRVLTRLILRSDLVGLTISQYVEIIRNGYSVSNAILLPHGSFDLPERACLPDEPETIHLLAFGKFGTYKKAEVLLDALPILRQRFPRKQFRITIAGTDNPNVKGYIDGLRVSYGNDPDIFFTGYVPEEDVEALFKSATLIVFPYTATTGSSGILHQAGSYARACVLPKMEDLERVVEEEGYAGAYFETANPASLAEAIAALVENPERRKQIEDINYKAAAALSMDDLVNWYLCHLDTLEQAPTGTIASFFGDAPKPSPALYGAGQEWSVGNQMFRLAEWTDQSGRKSWHLLGLNGALNNTSVAAIEKAVHDLDFNQMQGLYLDLSEVSHTDLLGLNALVQWHRRFESKGQKLWILCKANDNLHRWLIQSGLTRFLHLAQIHRS